MKKVKICPNAQCADRINSPSAMECKTCRMQLRNIKVEFFNSDEEIEKRLNPPAEENIDDKEEDKEDAPERMIVICSDCGKQIPYQIGLEFCECGEYIADIPPVAEHTLASEGAEGSGTKNETLEMVAGSVCGMETLDGVYRITFTEDYMKIGRTEVGKEYFAQYGKIKISREHITLQKIEGAWYLSYCKREERNYTGGQENAVYINERKLLRDENYQLKVGDIISMAKLDRTDLEAAFFRVV